MDKNEKLKQRQQEIFDFYYNELAVKTDKIFAYVFVFQWLLGIVLALWLSPKTWEGNTSQTHPHVYAAIFLGAAIASLPIYMIITRPGHYFNRYIVSIAQVFFTILLIHLSGGRIETHFHVFVSLAFLASYRDFRPVILFTIITALDHLLRGMYWPESVYGVLTASPLRAFEHSAWVIFEDIILLIFIKNGVEELKTIARHQATTEDTLSNVEQLIEERTLELKDSQQKLIYASKMSALGEMAGGVAHEINTPLAIINMKVEQMEESILEGDLNPEDFQTALASIKKTNDRISSIVQGLSFFARDGKVKAAEKARLHTIVNETLSFCSERFKNHGVTLEVNMSEIDKNLEIECRAVEISQVLLNLFNNAYDAIEGLESRWIRVNILNHANTVQINVSDSGQGIPKEIKEKIMQPFYTTKEIGKGTGLGLSISKGIIESHRGKLFLDDQSLNTCFTIMLPK